MLALEQSGHIAALALRLILLTGARKSEILNARWDNVNIEQRLLSIPLSKSGKLGDIWLFTSEITDRPTPDIYLFWDKLCKKDLRTCAPMIFGTLSQVFSSIQVIRHTKYRKCLGTATRARQTRVSSGTKDGVGPDWI